jgi:hypothetical protein
MIGCSRRQTSPPTISSEVPTSVTKAGEALPLPEGPVPCLDTLAGNKYCDLIAKELPQGFIPGFILNVDGFGNAGRCIDKLAKSKKFPAIRIHLTWYDNHTAPPRDFDAIARSAKQVQDLQNAHPGIQMLLSPVLEHNLTQENLNLLTSKIRRYAPTVKMFNTPWKGAKPQNWITEVHGVTPSIPRAPEYFVSFDGAGAVDEDVERWKYQYRTASVLCIWDTRLNGRYDKDERTRANRDTYPDARYMRSLIRLSYPITPAPKFWAPVSGLPSGFLIKTHAEDTNGKGERRDKPLAFTKSKLSSVSFVASNGREVCRLSYYGTYEGGRHRYYAGHRDGCNLYGYEIGAKAKALTGSEWVALKVGARLYGPFNPAFRAGFY